MDVQERRRRSVVESNPLLPIPRVDMGQMVLPSGANVECREVVEPLGHLRILLAQCSSSNEA